MEPQPSTSSQSLSPRKKRPRIALSVTEKLMIQNVYKHVFEEKAALLLPIEASEKKECVSKTADILGIGVTSVYSVLKEYKENEQFKSPEKRGPKHSFKDKLDDLTFAAIRRKVHNFFYANESPTIIKIFKVLNEDPDLPNFSWSTLRNVMKHLNFKYVTKSRQSILIDRQDIILWRQRYLQKIKEYRREGRNIILDNIAKRTKANGLLTPQPQSASKASRPDAVKTMRKKIQEEWEALKNASLISADSPDQNGSDVLLGIVAYIEINNVPKSTALRVILENLGATVKDDFSPEVTHVIFKRGSFDTFKRARLLNVHLVSVLWIEACKNSRKKIPEELFPVVDYEGYASQNTLRKFMEMGSNERKKLVQRGIPHNEPINKRTTRSSSKSCGESSDSHLVLQISTDESGNKEKNTNKTDRHKNKDDSESILPKAKNQRLFALEKDDTIDNDGSKKKGQDPNLKRRLFNPNTLDLSSAIDNRSGRSSIFVNARDINPYQIPKKRVARKKTGQNRNRAKTRRESAEKKDESCSENESDVERREQIAELLKLTQQQNEARKQEQTRRKRLVRVKKTKVKKLTQEEREDIRTANKIARRTEKQALRATQPRSCRKVNIYRDGILTPSLVSTSLHSVENAWLERSLRALGGFAFRRAVERDTTHVVAGSARRTINLLKAVARGCWVLSKRWVEDSVAAGRWLREHDYEMVHFSPAVQKSRLERQALGEDYHMDVFRDCGAIYISNHCSHCARKELRALVVLCSGRVVTDAGCARIAVGERVERATSVSEMWLLDSVQAGRCKSLKKYLIF